MKITLIRHTRVALPPGICYGITDIDVADTFEEEAQNVRNRLRGIEWDAVYSSPLTRCRKLAEYCGFTSVLLDKRLQELNFGRWEGLPWDAITDPALQTWYDNWLTTRAGGAESFEELYQRVASFLQELQTRPTRHVVLFTHGGVIRAALAYVGLYPFHQLFSIEINYGSLTTLEL